MASSNNETSSIRSSKSNLYGNIGGNSSFVDESVVGKSSLEDVAAGIARIENVLLDLTKQILILNDNMSVLLNQPTQTSSSNGQKANNLVQVDLQQTEIKRSTSIRTYHKDPSDTIGNLSLQIATLSTSVAQLISQRNSNFIPLQPPFQRIPRWNHDPYRNSNHPPLIPRNMAPRPDRSNSIDKEVDEVIEKFENMRLRPEVLRGILDYGLDRPSSVQQRGIPLLLKGQDIIAQAKTGQDKFSTYCIPILQNMELQSIRTQSLIITATNETAGHVYRLIMGLSTSMRNLECLLCISGSNIGDDVKKVQKRPHIIIGTPNRMCDLVHLDAIDLSYLKMFIIDEADVLLEQGFKDQAMELRRNFPLKTIVQTVLFCGNVNAEIMELTTPLRMREPVRILVKKNEQLLQGLRHYYLYVAVERSDWKFEALSDLLEGMKTSKIIIYCNKDSTKDSLCYKLCARNFHAVALHGEVGSSQRNLILDKFKSNKDNILITTDLITKGVDIEQSVQLVINFELPTKPEEYGKRIAIVSASGSGRQGVSILFVTSKANDMGDLRAIESFHKIKMPEIPVSQLAINLILGLGTLVLFSFLRPRNGIVYSPKQFASPDKQPPIIEENKLWGWVKPVLEADESLLIKKIGLDAIITYQDNNYEIPSNGNILQILSISYIEQPNWFWTHSVFTWIFSIIMYFFLYMEYSEYRRLRFGYFRSEGYRRSLHSRTLLITGVPKSKQSDKGLIEFMELIKVKFPISETVIARDVGELPELVIEREEDVRDLERALNKYLKVPDLETSKRPKHRKHIIFGRKVDSIEYFTRRIEENEARIIKLREKSLEEKRTLNYGFVAFETIHDAHSVVKHLDSVPSGGVKPSSILAPSVELAPMPQDIIWSNISMSPAFRSTQRWIGRLVFISLCFLWLIPLSFVTTVAHIGNLVKIFPFLKGFLDNAFITGLIESWMTPMILALFVLILPAILRWLTSTQGITTYSESERSVLGKLYLFFFINNLIIYTISSTLLDLATKIKASIDAGYLNVGDLTKVIFNPAILDDIAESAIKVSFFWINYISLRGLFAVWDLAQFFQLVYVWFKKKVISPTPRNLKELIIPPEFDYPVYYNIHLVETGGTFWNPVFNRLILAIIFWQFTMVGVMNLKGAHIQSIVVIPLIFLTLILKVFCSRTFDKSTRYYIPDTERTGRPSVIDKGKRKQEDLHLKFGHPSTTKELIIPMIHVNDNVKSQLESVYNGRITETTALTRRGKTKRILLVEEGDYTLRIQPIEESELYTIDPDNFNMGYAFEFDSRSILERDGSKLGSSRISFSDDELGKK
ncbi:8621_t:CDS:10 [Funneliformis mosseae]|uniref:8621_t:CDS:1 n=1 Tax=Funneliformis mosseae TaxID=27381 RepID=A0A9N9AAH2_FUNMO|nr:8621_t:CDS:10 [Funneliformis mosseae]